MNCLFSAEQCASTNDEILSHLTETQSEISGLYTLNQTGGRGQYGNSWNMVSGKNLALSVAVLESVFPSDIFINFYTACTVRDFVANLTDENAQIKWPNDIILKGKKICGILIEKKRVSGKTYYIAGIGLNINQSDFQQLPKAGSLFTQTGNTYDAKDVSEQLFTLFKDNISQKTDFKMLLAGFNEHLFRKNQISVFEIKGIRQNGIIRNVDSEGYLWTELENGGLQKFYHKEIEILY